MGFLSQETNRTAPCVLVHGLHGKGKTERAVRGGRPFVITTELKSRNRVRTINPAADGFYPESLVELEKLLEVLGSDKFHASGFDRVVLDSYTELTNALPDWIIRRHSPNLKLDPGRLIERQEYGPIQNWALAIVEGLMLTGLPVVILCRSEVKDGAVVLMSTGSSAKHLSSKVNATFEAVFSDELGYLWTSEPSPSSPRCGLEEVPQKFAGTASELLALIGGTPAPAAPAPPPAPNVRDQALARPAETLGDMAANVRQVAAETPAPIAQAASDFVDALSPEVASGDLIRAVADAYLAHPEVDPVLLLNYFAHKGHLVLFGEQKPLLTRLARTAAEQILPILADDNRRRAFVAHLKNGSYAELPTPAKG